MKLSEIAAKLQLKPVFSDYADRDVKFAYTGDLLSDVMGNAADESVLITIQAHKNTIAVASLKDSPAIILCNKRSIPDDMAEAAQSEGIALFTSGDNQFTVSGKLYPLLQA